MKYLFKKIHDSKVKINVSLSKEEMDFYLKEGEKELKNQARLNQSQKMEFSLEEIKEAAIKKAIFDTFLKIVKEKNLELIGKPKAKVEEFSSDGSFSYEIETEILPEIELGDYKEIAHKIFSQKREIEVSEKEVEETLEFLRNSRAKIKKLENGKEIKEIPPLNDEFAQSLGNFSSLEELKNSIREGIFQEKEIKERERLRELFIEEISKNLTLTLPESLVTSFTQENIDYFKNFLKGLGKDFETYLQETSQSEADFEAKMKELAQIQIKRSLILYQIAKEENIEASDEEVFLLAQKIASQQGLERISEVDRKRLLDYAKERIIFEKVFQFLENQ
ncbi:hypothetical protein J7K91_00150 [bacterium]|nr:hypothetical protein [bacterium]